MEPLSACSIASAVIQIVDFSSKVIARAKEIHTSAEGTFQDAAQLEAATNNLNDLLLQVESHANIVEHSAPPGQGTADEQLVALAKKSHIAGETLHAALNRVRRKKDGEQRNPFAQALRSVSEQKKIARIAEELNSIRKQVDTALLIQLRQHILGQVVTTKDPSLTQVKVATPRVEILASVYDHGWKPTEMSDLEAFSGAFLSSVVEKDVETRFADVILEKLFFPDLPDRYETIPQAHEDTFHWIFDTDRRQVDPDEWDLFPAWLSNTESNNLFWISGKPGSGKSTLMKYLFNHPRTREGLVNWTEGRPIVQAGFFFWNSGSVMQMSRMGLLQSILHQRLKDDRATLKQLFADRWQQFLACGGGRQDFTWAELRQTFEMMIANPLTPRAFFFVIDGLDEFDGDPKDLMDLVLATSKHPHVKICVASRPWLVFADALKNKPTLLLERLTRTDIDKYITSHFATNKHYVQLSRLDPERAAWLLTEIREKAAGVFLWVYLVVQSLLDGLTNADRMTDLVVRLGALPPTLEKLFDTLLKGLHSDYYKHACQLFRLVMIKPRPSLLALWFADNEHDDSAIGAEIRLLSDEEITDRLVVMNRRLVSRCKGFLGVEGWHQHPNATLSCDSSVDWIHRTARDFLNSESMWSVILDNTGHDAYDPERHWGNSYLGYLKAIPSIYFDDLRDCLGFATKLERHVGICPIAYLEEVGRTVATYQLCDWFQSDRIVRSGVSRDNLITPKTFLEVAMLLNLVGYVRLKLPEASRSEVDNAAHFYNSVCISREYEVIYTDKAASYSAQQDMKKIVESALRHYKIPYRRAAWKRTIKKFFE